MPSRYNNRSYSTSVHSAWSLYSLCCLEIPLIAIISSDIIFSAKRECTDKEFACEPSACIPISLRCDGVNHCHNLADEMNCNNSTHAFFILDLGGDIVACFRHGMVAELVYFGMIGYKLGHEAWSN